MPMQKFSLGGLGDMVSGAADFIGNNVSDIAAGAGNLIGVYNQNQAQENYYDTIAQAEDQAMRQQQEEYEYELQVAQLMAADSGGGGSSAPAVTGDMFNSYMSYMNQAQAAMKPWVDAGQARLPVATRTNNQVQNLIGNMLKEYETPEGQAKFNKSAPAISTQYNIPRRTA